MDFSMSGDGGNAARWRVSVIARLIAVVAYTIPLFGAALSSLFLMREFQSMKAAESAGIEAVMAAVKGSAWPVTISIYLAAIAGFVVIFLLVARAFAETATASPPIWFFAFCALTCLVPAGLFWWAEWSIIQVVSPGSSNYGNGIAAVGGQIANLLLLSIVSAPVILLVFLILFAVPLKSRSRLKWGPVAGATAIEVLLIAAALLVPFLIGEPQRKKELAALPENVKSADEDADIEKETSVVLILTSENKMFLEQRRQNGKAEDSVSMEKLPEMLKQLMQDKTPEKRIVYLKADVNAAYDNVLQIFDVIRKTDVDKAGLVAYGVTNPDNPYELYPRRFEVKLPEVGTEQQAPVRPNPLVLVAALDKDGKIGLNNEEMGTISDPKKLTGSLVRIFRQREDTGVFREGTNEVEKSIILKVNKACKYGDMIRLVEVVKLAGGQPIQIQIDDPVAVSAMPVSKPVRPGHVGDN